MSESTFSVAGMTCSKCVDAVTSEVSNIAGVSKVEVDLESGAVTVTSDRPLPAEEVAAAVADAGYELVTS